MAEVVKKQFKSKYHILIWIAVLSLIFMGMVEYGDVYKRQRDYSKIFEKYIALGPNIENKMGAHGMAWDVSDEYKTLYDQNGVIDNPEFISHGRPSIYECKEACNVVLTLSSCTNGKLAVRSWKAMEEKTGLSGLEKNAKGREQEKITFDDKMCIRDRN